MVPRAGAAPIGARPSMSLINLRHGIFLPPFHPNEENPTQCLGAISS